MAEFNFLKTCHVHYVKKYRRRKLKRCCHCVACLAISRLNCCNLLCVGLPLKNVWKLQLIQNVEARMLTSVGYIKHILPVLVHLH